MADEVRSLAQRNAVSTQEIRSIIEALQPGSRHAVEAMQQSSEGVAQGIAQHIAAEVEHLASSSRRLQPIANRLDALGRMFHP